MAGPSARFNRDTQRRHLAVRRRIAWVKHGRDLQREGAHPADLGVCGPRGGRTHNPRTHGRWLRTPTDSAPGLRRCPDSGSSVVESARRSPGFCVRKVSRESTASLLRPGSDGPIEGTDRVPHVRGSRLPPLAPSVRPKPRAPRSACCRDQKSMTVTPSAWERVVAARLTGTHAGSAAEPVLPRGHPAPGVSAYTGTRGAGVPYWLCGSTGER